jgi:hypothetical protein
MKMLAHHIPGLHDDAVLVVLVVQDEQGPVPVHLLVHIDDGRDHVRVDGVHVHAQHGPVHVPVVCIERYSVSVYAHRVHRGEERYRQILDRGRGRKRVRDRDISNCRAW